MDDSFKIFLDGWTSCKAFMKANTHLSDEELTILEINILQQYLTEFTNNYGTEIN